MAGLRRFCPKALHLRDDRRGVFVLGAKSKAIPALKNHWLAILLVAMSRQGFSASARGLFTWEEKAQAWFNTREESIPCDT